MPTGAIRITPPHPLLSFAARVTLPRLECRAERQVVPGERRLKSFRCCRSQPDFAVVDRPRWEISCHQPTRVRTRCRAKKIRGLTSESRRELSREHALTGKERHLGIVGDRP